MDRSVISSVAGAGSTKRGGRHVILMARLGSRLASVTTAPNSTGTLKALLRPVVSVSQNTKLVMACSWLSGEGADWVLRCGGVVVHDLLRRVFRLCGRGIICPRVRSSYDLL